MLPRSCRRVSGGWAHPDSSYNRLAVLLYYVTDGKAFAGNNAQTRAALLCRIGQAARAGVDYIQLREKELDAPDLERLAREALRIIRENSSQTSFLVNTHADIALAVGADGVHLPAGSLPASEMRARWLRHRIGRADSFSGDTTRVPRCSPGVLTLVGESVYG